MVKVIRLDHKNNNKETLFFIISNANLITKS